MTNFIKILIQCRRGNVCEGGSSQAAFFIWFIYFKESILYKALGEVGANSRCKALILQNLTVQI